MTLDSQHYIDTELIVNGRSGNIKLLVSSVHYLLIFLNFILFISWFLQFTGAGIHFKNVVFVFDGNVS